MSTRMEDLRNQLLQDVADHVAAVLAEYHIERDVAEQAGGAVADHLANLWGGQVVSFPKDTQHKLALRDVAIVHDFNGHNFSFLARRYNLTERAIRRIIERARAIHDNAAQSELFQQ